MPHPYLIHSRSAIGMGGLVRRLFEMLIGNGLGCWINLEQPNLMDWLFAELSGGIVFAAGCLDWVQFLEGDFQVIGHVAEDAAITILVPGNYAVKISQQEMGEQWRKTFAEVVS